MKTEGMRSVLRLISDTGNERWPTPGFQSTGGRHHVVSLDPNVWNDMGRPDIITVTVEPGDRLNEPQIDPYVFRP